jgi:predicted outer membrane repeat protein
MTLYRLGARPHPVTRLRTMLARITVSGLAVCAGLFGTGAASAAGAVGCDRPALLKVPATTRAVGSGTAASCTQTALRAAVNRGGHITFDCGDDPVTIPVTTELRVKKTTVIDGRGKITLDGKGKNRILGVEGSNGLSARNLRFVNGAAAASTDRAVGAGGAIAGLYRAHVEVVGSTFVDNRAGLGGGAVYGGVEGTLTIIDSAFSGNRSWYGGAVYSLLSPLTVIDSTFTGNGTINAEGMGEGGAIGTDGAGVNGPGNIRLCGVTVRNNKAFASGGGAYLWAYAPQKIVVEKSTFADNTVAGNGHGSAGSGGAARISIGPSDIGTVGSVTIRDTSFLANTSTQNGGGLYLDCAPICKVSNSTFYGNTAGAYGGAIFGDGHHDDNVTFVKNTAGGHGGALFGSRFVLNNSVFAGNAAKNPWGQAMTCSTTGTGEHVVQWLKTSRDTSTKCVSTVLAKNPRLAAPADNGGPTVTMMPGSDSPVLRAGGGCMITDQRGERRTASACDIGAVQRTTTMATRVPASAQPSARPSAGGAGAADVVPSSGSSGATPQMAGAVSLSAGRRPAGSHRALISAGIAAAAGMALLVGLTARRARRPVTGEHTSGGLPPETP